MTPTDQLFHILNRLFQIEPQQFRDEIGPEDISRWDSIRHLALISEIEDAFEIEFGMDEISRMRSIGDIRKRLAMHGISC